MLLPHMPRGRRPETLNKKQLHFLGLFHVAFAASACRLRMRQRATSLAFYCYRMDKNTVIIMTSQQTRASLPWPALPLELMIRKSRLPQTGSSTEGFGLGAGFFCLVPAYPTGLTPCFCGIAMPQWMGSGAAQDCQRSCCDSSAEEEREGHVALSLRRASDDRRKPPNKCVYGKHRLQPQLLYTFTR